MTELPKRLGVIGAGPVGCEMAQVFARFGTEVYLVEAMPGILPREDPDAAGIVQSALERDGVKVFCGTTELRISSADNGVRMQMASHGRAREVAVDQLLVAAGRTPNVANLGLEIVGVDFDKTGVSVNDRLQTSNPIIYACGDVCSPYKFTHAADFMARIVIQNALFRGRKRVSDLVIPWCTYTSPEIARVGLNPHEAEQHGIAVETLTQDLKDVDRAILDGETEGFVRIHKRKGTDRIVGATIVAAHAGELISELTLAMSSKVGLKRMATVIHPYPTQSEAIRMTGDAYNRTRLTPFVKSLINRWLAWQRHG